MASDLAFVQHVCDQLRGAGDVSFKKMFGEYAVYVGAKTVALVCDNQLFLKPTAAGRALLPHAEDGAPYPGAKPHLLITPDQWEDTEWLCDLVRATARELPQAKPKVKKSKS